MLLRSADGAGRSAVNGPSPDPCQRTSSADAMRRSMVDTNAVDDDWQIAGCGSTAAAAVGSEALQAAAQQRAARAVRRQLLMSAAGGAARSAGHVGASMPASGSKSVPAAESLAKDVIVSCSAAERQKHCRPSGHQDTGAGSCATCLASGKARNGEEVAQPCAEALQQCMPTCPPSKAGRRCSIWAPACLDDAAL